MYGLRRASCHIQLVSQVLLSYAVLEQLTPIGYSSVLGHRNWQIQTAGWNWASFFTEGLETRWQRFGQFLNDL